MNTASLKMCITVFLLLILFFSWNYHATGELSSTSKDFTSLYYPHGIDLDSLGNVYVTDSRDLYKNLMQMVTLF